MTETHVGEKLRGIRESLGLEQKEWAKLLQVSPITVTRWEGSKSMPTGSGKIKIDSIFNIFKDDVAKKIIAQTLISSGLPGTAAFMGMLFGALACLGTHFDSVSLMFEYKPSLFDGILGFRNTLKIPGASEQTTQNTKNRRGGV